MENIKSKINKENIFYFAVLALLIFMIIKLITSYHYSFYMIIGLVVPFIYFLLCFLYISTYRFQRVITKIVLGLYIGVGTILKVGDYLIESRSSSFDKYAILHILIGIIVILILNGFQFHKSKRYSTRVYHLRNIFKLDGLKKCDEVIKRQDSINKHKQKSNGKL